MREQGTPCRTFAELLGISRQHFTDILAGRVSVGLDLHAQIANGIGVDAADLLGELPRGLSSAEARADLRRVLAHNLRSSMREHAFCPNGLATLAGISPRSVYNALTMTVGVGYDVLAAFGAALGRTPDAFLRQPRSAISCRIDDTPGSRSVPRCHRDSRAGEATNAVQLQRR